MIKENVQKLKIIFIPSETNNYRPKFLESRILLYCLIVLLILKLFTLPFFFLFPKNVFFATVVESTLIKLTNQYRQATGLQPLKENPHLKQAALLKAKDMLERDYFSHFTPEGISPWHWLGITGYKYKIAGENLAIGFLDAEQVHKAWLTSPSHRANLLNPNFQEIGVGVIKGYFQGNETTLVVQFFASPVISPIEVQPEPPGEKVEEETEEKVEKVEKEVEEPVGSFKEQVAGNSFTSIPRPTSVKKELMFKFISFFSSDFQQLLQKVIYGFLILIIVSLIINIFVRFDIQHPDLIFKTIVFIGLLMFFALLDKTDIIKLIFPDFAIY